MARRNAIADEEDEPAVSGGVSLGRLEGLVGFHLRMATAALYRDFAAAMEGTGLTQKLCAVLELIDSNAGISQSDIAAALQTDRATVMALIDRLDERGFIGRHPSAHDRRRQSLTLTPLGRDALEDARGRIVGHERGIIERLGSGGADQLTGLLRRIYRS